MELVIRIGDKYVVSKDVMYTWSMYTRDEEIAPIHSIDSAYKNHSLYMKVGSIKRLSEQFVEVEFVPVSKMISGDVSYCRFIVYDDTIVKLPDPYQNYIGQSKLLKSMFRATPEIEMICQDIEKHYITQTAEIRKLQGTIEYYRMELELLKDQGKTVRNKLDKQFTTANDELVFNKKEERAYDQEVIVYIEK